MPCKACALLSSSSVVELFSKTERFSQVFFIVAQVCTQPLHPTSYWLHVKHCSNTGNTLRRPLSVVTGVAMRGTTRRKVEGAAVRLESRHYCRVFDVWGYYDSFLQVCNCLREMHRQKHATGVWVYWKLKSQVLRVSVLVCTSCTGCCMKMPRRLQENVLTRRVHFARELHAALKLHVQFYASLQHATIQK